MASLETDLKISTQVKLPTKLPSLALDDVIYEKAGKFGEQAPSYDPKKDKDAVAKMSGQQVQEKFIASTRSELFKDLLASDVKSGIIKTVDADGKALQRFIAVDSPGYTEEQKQARINEWTKAGARIGVALRPEDVRDIEAQLVANNSRKIDGPQAIEQVIRSYVGSDTVARDMWDSNYAANGVKHAKLSETKALQEWIAQRDETLKANRSVAIGAAATYGSRLRAAEPVAVPTEKAAVASAAQSASHGASASGTDVASIYKADGGFNLKFDDRKVLEEQVKTVLTRENFNQEYWKAFRQGFDGVLGRPAAGNTLYDGSPIQYGKTLVPVEQKLREVSGLSQDRAHKLHEHMMPAPGDLHTKFRIPGNQNNFIHDAYIMLENKLNTSEKKAASDVVKIMAEYDKLVDPKAKEDFIRKQVQAAREETEKESRKSGVTAPRR